MEYAVKFTELALSQIQETVSHISKILHEPEIADKWADYLQKQISSLNTLPARYPLTDEEPWHTRGIRKMAVKNFLVYYLIDKEQQTVLVTAVIYGRRDQISALLDI